MLSAELWQQNEGLARGCLAHPFMVGLEEGTLPRDTFRGFIAQDAFFLEAFARAYALGLARSEGPEAMALFHELIGGVRQELELHAAYAKELEIDLASVEPNGACRAYTDFLLATAWQRTLGEILAAMAPCMRLYLYLGEELLRKIGGPEQIDKHPYGRWITTYSNPEFRGLCVQFDQMLDRYGADTPGVSAAYRYAMQCEWDFFSAALAAGAAKVGAR